MSVGGSGTRWILGFDGGCGTCGYLAQELVELSGGKLTAQSLHSFEVQAWRERTLGPDAPWVPTLFAVEGDEVRAWTGNGLIARLARLVGPHKMWQIATIVGGLMEQPEEPVSPGRRLAVRQGLVGTATAFALLNGSRGSSLSALAQGSSSSSVVYEAEKLTPSQFTDLHRRSERNTHYGIIRDYFAQDRGCRGQGRGGARMYRNGRLLRRGVFQIFKGQGEREWAYVHFVLESDGREMASGLLYRGEQKRFTDRFYVQNGKLRRESRGVVSVTRSANENISAAQEIPGETYICGTATYGSCGAVIGISALLCPITWFSCAVTAVSAYGRSEFGGAANDQCQDCGLTNSVCDGNNST